ncbi:uncharacterized protein RHIMIDRAFT_283169 [Rhizopus microsporus ATCC 52813]|uniref:Uncharacterized protein n=1 Tax=Rhizopus microsporus ATCC 52813 TaxID=1340429 RepID=A0A2G4SWJ5_RHIZD|nr:uncharacterized protein RHIMIDRAFT_283169 [Rhizopus microsporus ATCC 52813]PHZ12736.1 hypothetical protein RHIMIDRAFT_283169 [Rhizopus microsporus ATCC 52813]
MTRSMPQGLQSSFRSLLYEYDMSFEEIAQRLYVFKYTVLRYCDAWRIVRPANLDRRSAVLNGTSR